MTMDSKTPPPPSSYDNNEESAPPSYSSIISTPVTSSTSQYYSTQIASQLTNLTSRISSLQVQKRLLSHAQDEHLLSLLTPQIQLYLSDFANTGLQRGTLILIPAAGLEGESALPCEYDFKNPDEYDRVVRVRDKAAEEYEAGPKWFWHDEEMAERLAGYLRPKADLRTLELPPRKEEIVQQQTGQSSSSGSSKWGWGRKKTAERPPLTPVEPRAAPEKSDTKLSKSDDKVVMEVKAEEVVFRTENEFGMYGTERGWGVVVKLRVTLGSR